MSAGDYTVLAQTRDEVGEGPIWRAHDNSLLWVDLFGQRLHRLALDDGAVRSWPMPEPIGWVVERAGRNDLLAGLQSGIHALLLDPLALTHLHALEPHLSAHRLNDAKVDPQGRLWAGTMHAHAETPTGNLHRIGPGFQPTTEDSGYLVPNGPAFAPDGRTMYHADSARSTVHRFIIAADGRASGREPFLVFDEADGLPDGMTVDAEGCLWVAHWDGGHISRFSPDGALLRTWPLPVSRITSCCFGGPALDRLFVTSAVRDRAHEPLAGALFEIDPGVRGIAPVPFAG